MEDEVSEGGELWDVLSPDHALNVAVCADGGVLREVYKDPSWGQVVVRTIPPGGRTNPHFHPKTDEMWLLLRGQLTMVMERIGVFQLRERAWTHVAPGVGHFCHNDGAEEAVLLFVANRVYDPEEPDTHEWIYSPVR
jgi:quercetin dioxygenase-like cupin family protein